MQKNNGSGDGSTFEFWPSFLILSVILLGYTFFDVLDGTLFLGDVDSALRAIQIHQLLDGGAWYDLTLKGVAIPEVYVSPWSRIVDAPYVAMAYILSPFIGLKQGAEWAFLIWPSVLLVAFCAFSVATMKRLAPQNIVISPVSVAIAGLTMSYASFEFSPGNIDHHNVQLVALLAALLGVCLWNVRGGILTGVAIAISVNVGLEALPLVAVLYAGIVFTWIAGAQGSGPFFRSFCLTSVFVAPVLALLAAGPDVLLAVHNDIFSLPYAIALGGFSAICWSVALFLKEDTSPLFRFFAVAVPGAVLLAVIIVAIPSILDGPYAMIDPLTRSLWLSRLAQEKPIFQFIADGQVGMLFNTMLQGTVLLLVAIAMLRFRALLRAPVLIVFAVSAVSLVLTVILARNFPFPGATVGLFIPMLFGVLRLLDEKMQQKSLMIFGSVAVLLALVLYGVSALLLKTRPAEALTASDFLSYDSCTSGDYQAFTGAPKGKYLLPLGMGVRILQKSIPGVDVSSIPFHRASHGIHAMYEAFLQTDSTTRNAALEPFDYLAFCDYPFSFDAPEGSLFAALLANRAWPGLEPVTMPGSERLKVFRINHQALQ